MILVELRRGRLAHDAFRAEGTGKQNPGGQKGGGGAFSLRWCSPGEIKEGGQCDVHGLIGSAVVNGAGAGRLGFGRSTPAWWRHPPGAGPWHRRRADQRRRNRFLANAHVS